MNMRWRHLLPLLVLLLGAVLYPQSTGSQIIVNTTHEGDQTSPVMDADNSGNHIVVWISTPQDNGIAGIYARLFDSDGDPAAEEFKVNTYWGPHGHPDVAMGPLGNFIVVSENYWIEGPVSSAVIARIYDLSGEPLGPEFIVNQQTDDFQGAPVVGIDSLGQFVVIWQAWGQDGDGFGIYARLFDGLGNPLGAEFRVNTYISGDQIQPTVAMEETGEFVVVWTSSSQDGDQSGVFAKRFDRTGDPLGQEFQVNSASLGRQEHPDIGMDSLGNFVVCWQRYELDEEEYAVYARTFDRTAELKGTEFQVHEPSPDWQVFPSIDCDSLGNFLIAWQDRAEDGAGFDILARTFDTNGQAQGPAFQVNAAGAGRQYIPATVMMGLTNYFLSWQSRDEEGAAEWDIAYRPYRSAAARASEARRRLKRNHEYKTIKHCPGSAPAGSTPAGGAGTGL